MHIPPLSSIFLAVVFSYVSYSIWSMAQIFIAPKCTQENKCLRSYLSDRPELTLFVFSSVKSTPRIDSEVELIEILKNFQYLEPWEKELQVTIPSKTRQNGSLYFNLIVMPSNSVENSRWSSLMNNRDIVLTKIPLTQLHVPEMYIFNLLNEDKVESPPKKTKNNFVKPVSHLRTQVTFNIVTDPMSMPMDNIPGEIHNRLRLMKGMKYLPIMQYNFLETKIEHLKMFENSTEIITLKYSPVHIGKLRFIIHVEEAMRSLKALGFSSKDIDDVKNIFAGTNLYILSATIIIVSFHLLFDFLAFKNDVSFWRNKSSMEGLSSRAVLWRAFSQFIVFLYLLDEQASFIVLAPSGIAVLIEFWKALKVLRRNKEVMSDSEKKTNEYDAESMKYLSYLLYPLCIGGAIYSLLYQPHKSWYSWSIHSLVNGVYAFGFLFMLPQLFVNYRLKSVAALPWRAFMYKAFNTFIDDVFAFLITMPAAHRVACFRDDVIFLIYLYQRWLYPVDKSRVDETAQALGEKAENDKKTD